MKAFLLIISCIFFTACSHKPTLTSESTIPLELLHFNQVITALSNQQTYQLDITRTSPQEASETYKVAYMKPDLYQTQITGKTVTETFRYQGEHQYYQEPATNEWYQLSLPKADPAMDAAKIDYQAIFDSIKNGSSRLSETEEVQNGVAALRLLITSKKETTLEVIANQANYLPIKYLKTDNVNSKTEAVYSYNAEVIALPSNPTPFVIPENPDTLTIKTMERLYAKYE